jgi:hypothetical protein
LETEISVSFGCRAGIVLFAATLMLTGIACKSQRSRVTVQNEEPKSAEAQLASTVRMGDPAAASQLLSGFSSIENKSWRWTSGKFSVKLRTPPAAVNGATVAFSFPLPEIIIHNLGKIQLTVSAGGTYLNSQAYDMPGAYVLSADIPPGPLLQADAITVDYTVNKTYSAPPDKRELAVVANSVSINPK